MIKNIYIISCVFIGLAGIQFAYALPPHMKEVKGAKATNIVSCTKKLGGGRSVTLKRECHARMQNAHLGMKLLLKMGKVKPEHARANIAALPDKYYPVIQSEYRLVYSDKGKSREILYSYDCFTKSDVILPMVLHDAVLVKDQLIILWEIQGSVFVKKININKSELQSLGNPVNNGIHLPTKLDFGGSLVESNILDARILHIGAVSYFWVSRLVDYQLFSLEDGKATREWVKKKEIPATDS